MQLDIITPDKTLYSGLVDLVQLPGTDGLFEILHNHAPLIASLGTGRIKVVDKNEEQHYFEINSGTLEVLHNKIIVLAE